MEKKENEKERKKRDMCESFLEFLVVIVFVIEIQLIDGVQYSDSF